MNLQELFEKIKNEMKLRNFSRLTIKSYLGCLNDYFKYIKTIKKDPEINQIKQYLLKKTRQRAVITNNQPTPSGYQILL